MTREEQSVKMGKRLKALREETSLNGKKMSHEKLKEKLKEIYGVEISRDSLMNYEVSDVNHSKFGTNLKMNVEYLNCLSSFYGVSTDYLLGRSDAKTANEDIHVACKTTGLSSDAIESLRFDHSQSKRRDIFAFEDFLIKESYVTFWAVQMRNSVKNIIQVNSLQSKLGSDIVTDETNFHRWLAMSSFEKSFNKAVEEFANLYSDDLKIADTNAYLTARKNEYEKYLKRIEELQSSQK